MRWFLLLLSLCFAGAVFAHGGEDHGQAAAPILTRDSVVASATGSLFEAVLKSQNPTPNEDSALTLLLSDFATNSPTREATIDIDIKGPNGFKAKPTVKASKTPGLYELTANFPEYGDYSFGLTIQVKDKADLLAINPFQLKAPEESAARSNPLLWLAGGAALLVAVLFGFLLGRIQKKVSA